MLMGLKSKLKYHLTVFMIYVQLNLKQLLGKLTILLAKNKILHKHKNFIIFRLKLYNIICKINLI